MPKTYKRIPTFYFNPDGSKAKCYTEGGFYRNGQMVEKLIADEILDIWDNDKSDSLLTLQETLQNIEIRHGLL